jgi:C-terminal processing protease CtpA/Prc
VAAAGRTVGTRLERLAGLARLSAEIRYLHLSLAFAEVDWDESLLAVIPKVWAARSRAAFRRSLEGLVATLGAPPTEVLTDPKPTAPRSPAPPPTLRWITTKTALVSTGAGDAPELFGAAWGEAAGAPAVVLDLRGLESSGVAIVAHQLARRLDHPLDVPGWRYRQHLGLESDSHWQYTAALVETAPRHFPSGGGAGGPTPRLVVVVGEEETETVALAAGLQESASAVVITTSRSFGLIRRRCPVGDGLAVAFPVAELVHSDREAGFSAEFVAAETDPVAAALSRLHLHHSWRRPAPAPASPRRARPVPPAAASPIRGLDPARREVRLLGLFHLLGDVRFFFPHHAGLDPSWDALVEPALEACAQANGAAAYASVMCRLLVHLGDGHAGLQGPPAVTLFGDGQPRVAVRPIGGEAVVVHVDGDSASDVIEVGEVVASVDGEATASRLARLSFLVAASVPGARDSVLHRFHLLSGPAGSKCSMEVGPSGGPGRTVVLMRDVDDVEAPPTLPTVTVLPEGFGYLDLGRLDPADVDRAMDDLRATPGLVVDLRRYPCGAGWRLASHLTESARVVALVRTPAPSGIDPGQEQLGQVVVKPAGSDPYRGPVAVLINEETTSQGEQFCLLLAGVAPVTFVGSRSSGTNGEIRLIPLPGGLWAHFSAMDVSDPRGRSRHGTGIEPHVEARPTIEGLRQGRDEVLEAAVRLLQRQAPTT